MDILTEQERAHLSPMVLKISLSRLFCQNLFKYYFEPKYLLRNTKRIVLKALDFYISAVASGSQSLVQYEKFGKSKVSISLLNSYIIIR